MYGIPKGVHKPPGLDATFGRHTGSASTGAAFAFRAAFMLSDAPKVAAPPRRTGDSMTVALIVAAGRGHRLGGPIPKQYRKLDGVPIIRRTVEALRRHSAIRAVQVVIAASDRDLYDAATDGLAMPEPVIGGASRQESVRNGLEGITRFAPATVLIHDGVRPFIEPAVIGAVIEALDRVPGAVVGVPLTDTLKRCEGMIVTGTIDRTGLWRAQTPQGFRHAAILEAHRRVQREMPAREFTDDCAVAEETGLAVAMVPGSEDNFKITTESDLVRAEALLRERARTGT